MHTGKKEKRKHPQPPATRVHHSHQLNPIIPRPRQSSFNLNNDDIAVLVHGHRKLDLPRLTSLHFGFFYLAFTITILPRAAGRSGRIFPLPFTSLLPFAGVSGGAKCPTHIRYAGELVGEGRENFSFFSSM